MASNTGSVLRAVWLAAMAQGGTLRLPRNTLEDYPGDKNVSVFVMTEEGTGDLLIKANHVGAPAAAALFDPRTFCGDLGKLDDAQLADYVAAREVQGGDGMGHATREALVRLLRRSSIEKPSPWVERELRRGVTTQKDAQS